MNVLKDINGNEVELKSLLYSGLENGGGKMTLEEAMEKRPPQWLIDAAVEHFSVPTFTTSAPTKHLSYNEDTGFFEANGLTDITPAQMIEILGAYLTTEVPALTDDSSTFAISPVAVGNKLKVRTIPPITIKGNYSWNKWDSTFKGFIALESVYWISPSQNPDTFVDTFYRCISLKTILGTVRVAASMSANTFYRCDALENIKFDLVRFGVNLQWSPKLSYASVSNLVTRLTPSGGSLNFTVHKDVYAALTGEAASYPVNGGTQEQWEALVETAASRNIIFVSA